MTAVMSRQGTAQLGMLAGRGRLIRAGLAAISISASGTWAMPAGVVR
jgi:hypothetical protein